jgi:hypothetical protein
MSRFSESRAGAPDALLSAMLKLPSTREIALDAGVWTWTPGDRLHRHPCDEAAEAKTWRVYFMAATGQAVFSG